ncbi:MAG: hypothetical protein Q4G30_02240 [Actinomycetaceae bacterium]|nr:hypothetical protein [Actinomycetaceae bacterium]
MRPIDGVGALNPALTNQAFTRPVDAPDRPSSRPAPVSEASKPTAPSTSTEEGYGQTAKGFTPVIAASDASRSELPNSYKSGDGTLDISM